MKKTTLLSLMAFLSPATQSTKHQNDVALSLPTGDEWRFATGAQYQITPQSNIGFAVSYLNMQSSRVQSPEQFKGSYDNPYLWFASLNYSYQF